MMQCTAELHHHVAHPVFPHPDGLLEYAAAFDPAFDMCDAHAPLRDLSIVCLLLRRHLFPSRLLRRLDDGHALERARLKPVWSNNSKPA